MPRQVRLARVVLTYADGMVLHTATSGAVPELDEVRLVVEQDGGVAALGATRVNIEYLSGYPSDVLTGLCVSVAETLDWRLGWEAFVAALDMRLPAPVRMLFEMAARDGAAREQGISLAQALGGGAVASVPSNQTLFRCDDATLLRRAEAYAARGFRDLKLRIGFADFADDLRRLSLLRERFGASVRLSADANGSWDAASAPARLQALEQLDMQYLEQPLPADAWEATALLAGRVPIMLDESLSAPETIDRLIATQAAALAHLKLAKLGGLDRLMQAGRRLAAAGIGVMVGQMNEGSVSTLAAAHAAAALGVELCELYGADGLAGDPAGTLRYADGRLHLPAGRGIGLDRHDPAGRVLWERRV